MLVVLILLVLCVLGLAFYVWRLAKRIVALEEDGRSRIGFNSKATLAATMAKDAIDRVGNIEDSLRQNSVEVSKILNKQKQVESIEKEREGRKAKHRRVVEPIQAQGWEA